MSKVIYTTDEGLKEVRDVPNTLATKDYHLGILIGPPDLSSLKLDKKKLRELNHALVDAGLLQWPDLSGQRHRLVGIISKIWDKPERQRDMKLKILVIYQQDYFFADGEI
jgi:hypothetical protein